MADEQDEDEVTVFEPDLDLEWLVGLDTEIVWEPE